MSTKPLIGNILNHLLDGENEKLNLHVSHLNNTSIRRDHVYIGEGIWDRMKRYAKYVGDTGGRWMAWVLEQISLAFEAINEWLADLSDLSFFKVTSQWWDRLNAFAVDMIDASKEGIAYLYEQFKQVFLPLFSVGTRIFTTATETIKEWVQQLASLVYVDVSQWVKALIKPFQLIGQYLYRLLCPLFVAKKQAIVETVAVAFADTLCQAVQNAENNEWLIELAGIYESWATGKKIAHTLNLYEKLYVESSHGATIAFGQIWRLYDTMRTSGRVYAAISTDNYFYWRCTYRTIFEDDTIDFRNSTELFKYVGPALQRVINQDTATLNSAIKNILESSVFRDAALNAGRYLFRSYCPIEPYHSPPSEPNVTERSLNAAISQYLKRIDKDDAVADRLRAIKATGETIKKRTPATEEERLKFHDEYLTGFFRTRFIEPLKACDSERMLRDAQGYDDVDGTDEEILARIHVDSTPLEPFVMEVQVQQLTLQALNPKSDYQQFLNEALPAVRQLTQPAVRVGARPPAYTKETPSLGLLQDDFKKWNASSDTKDASFIEHINRVKAHFNAHPNTNFRNFCRSRTLTPEELERYGKDGSGQYLLFTVYLRAFEILSSSNNSSRELFSYFNDLNASLQQYTRIRQLLTWDRALLWVGAFLGLAQIGLDAYVSFSGLLRPIHTLFRQQDRPDELLKDAKKAVKYFESEIAKRNGVAIDLQTKLSVKYRVEGGRECSLQDIKTLVDRFQNTQGDIRRSELDSTAENAYFFIENALKQHSEQLDKEFEGLTKLNSPFELDRYDVQAMDHFEALTRFNQWLYSAFPTIAAYRPVSNGQPASDYFKVFESKYLNFRKNIQENFSKAETFLVKKTARNFYEPKLAVPETSSPPPKKQQVQQLPGPSVTRPLPSWTTSEYMPPPAFAKTSGFNATLVPIDLPQGDIFWLRQPAAIVYPDNDIPTFTLNKPTLPFYVGVESITLTKEWKFEYPVQTEEDLIMRNFFINQIKSFAAGPTPFNEIVGKFNAVLELDAKYDEFVAQQEYLTKLKVASGDNTVNSYIYNKFDPKEREFLLTTFQKFGGNDLLSDTFSEDEIQDKIDDISDLLKNIAPLIDRVRPLGGIFDTSVADNWLKSAAKYIVAANDKNSFDELDAGLRAASRTRLSDANRKVLDERLLTVKAYIDFLKRDRENLLRVNNLEELRLNEAQATLAKREYAELINAVKVADLSGTESDEFKVLRGKAQIYILKDHLTRAGTASKFVSLLENEKVLEVARKYLDPSVPDKEKASVSVAMYKHSRDFYQEIQKATDDIVRMSFYYSLKPLNSDHSDIATALRIFSSYTSQIWDMNEKESLKALSEQIKTLTHNLSFWKKKLEEKAQGASSSSQEEEDDYYSLETIQKNVVTFSSKINDATGGLSAILDQVSQQEGTAFQESVAQAAKVSLKDNPEYQELVVSIIDMVEATGDIEVDKTQIYNKDGTIREDFDASKYVKEFRELQNRKKLSYNSFALSVPYPKQLDAENVLTVISDLNTRISTGFVVEKITPASINFIYNAYLGCMSDLVIARNLNQIVTQAHIDLKKHKLAESRRMSTAARAAFFQDPKYLKLSLEEKIALYEAEDPNDPAYFKPNTLFIKEQANYCKALRGMVIAVQTSTGGLVPATSEGTIKEIRVLEKLFDSAASAHELRKQQLLLGAEDDSVAPAAISEFDATVTFGNATEVIMAHAKTRKDETNRWLEQLPSYFPNGVDGHRDLHNNFAEQLALHQDRMKLCDKFKNDKEVYNACVLKSEYIMYGVLEGIADTLADKAQTVTPDLYLYARHVQRAMVSKMYINAQNYFFVYTRLGLNTEPDADDYAPLSPKAAMRPFDSTQELIFFNNLIKVDPSSYSFNQYFRGLRSLVNYNTFFDYVLPVVSVKNVRAALDFSLLISASYAGLEGLGSDWSQQVSQESIDFFTQVTEASNSTFFKSKEIGFNIRQIPSAIGNEFTASLELCRSAWPMVKSVGVLLFKAFQKMLALAGSTLPFFWNRRSEIIQGITWAASGIISFVSLSHTYYVATQLISYFSGGTVADITYNVPLPLSWVNIGISIPFGLAVVPYIGAITTLLFIDNVFLRYLVSYDANRVKSETTLDTFKSFPKITGHQRSISVIRSVTSISKFFFNIATSWQRFAIPEFNIFPVDQVVNQTAVSTFLLDKGLEAPSLFTFTNLWNGILLSYGGFRSGEVLYQWKSGSRFKFFDIVKKMIEEVNEYLGELGSRKRIPNQRRAALEARLDALTDTQKRDPEQLLRNIGISWLYPSYSKVTEPETLLQGQKIEFPIEIFALYAVVDELILEDYSNLEAALARVENEAQRDEFLLVFIRRRVSRAALLQYISNLIERETYAANTPFSSSVISNTPRRSERIPEPASSSNTPQRSVFTARSIFK